MNVVKKLKYHHDMSYKECLRVKSGAKQSTNGTHINSIKAICNKLMSWWRIHSHSIAEWQFNETTIVLKPQLLPAKKRRRLLFVINSQATSDQAFSSIDGQWLIAGLFHCLFLSSPTFTLKWRHKSNNNRLKTHFNQYKNNFSSDEYSNAKGKP